MCTMLRRGCIFIVSRKKNMCVCTTVSIHPLPLYAQFMEGLWPCAWYSFSYYQKIWISYNIQLSSFFHSSCAPRKKTWQLRHWAWTFTLNFEKLAQIETRDALVIWIICKFLMTYLIFVRVDIIQECN